MRTPSEDQCQEIGDGLPSVVVEEWEARGPGPGPATTASEAGSGATARPGGRAAGAEVLAVTEQEQVRLGRWIQTSHRRFGRAVPESRPGASVHEVWAAEGNMAGQLC